MKTLNNLNAHIKSLRGDTLRKLPTETQRESGQDGDPQLCKDILINLIGSTPGRTGTENMRLYALGVKLVSDESDSLEIDDEDFKAVKHCLAENKVVVDTGTGQYGSMILGQIITLLNKELVSE